VAPIQAKNLTNRNKKLISAPSTEDHPTVLADWLEMLAIASPERQSNILSLAEVRDITQDTEAEDVADFDAGNDAIISRVTTELEHRIKLLNSAYPFRINEAGSLLKMQNGLGTGATIYLFCLLMSHVSNSSLLERFDLSTEAQTGRDIFQICATLSAAGFCEGAAVSFGWPRLDRTTFAEKLVQTYTTFGDGRPRAVPEPGAPEHIKDGGIDVIAWRPPRDRLPGTIYLLGQVASGHRWQDKSVLKDIDTFHWAWFEVQPTSQSIGAMFVPFCITDTGESAGDFAEQELLISKMQFITKEFGNFLYRYRLPFFADRVARLNAEGVTPIEGFSEVGRIIEWVNAFSARLEAAA
jgi:hypothetical protein